MYKILIITSGKLSQFSSTHAQRSTSRQVWISSSNRQIFKIRHFTCGRSQNVRRKVHIKMADLAAFMPASSLRPPPSLAWDGTDGSRDKAGSWRGWWPDVAERRVALALSRRRVAAPDTSTRHSAGHRTCLTINSYLVIINYIYISSKCRECLRKLKNLRAEQSAD